MKIQYLVKKQAFIKKNSTITIQPGVYGPNTQPKKVWDYLLTLKGVCSKIEKEELSETSSISLKVNFEEADSPLELEVKQPKKNSPQSKSSTRPRTGAKSNQKQGD